MEAASMRAADRDQSLTIVEVTLTHSHSRALSLADDLAGESE